VAWGLKIYIQCFFIERYGISAYPKDEAPVRCIYPTSQLGPLTLCLTTIIIDTAQKGLTHARGIVTADAAF
jgi:hypothetical protein